MEALGINAQWFLFQLGNFIILFVGMSWLLHKPVLKLLDSRREAARETLELSEKMRAEAAVTEERQKELLSQARQEASQLLSAAKQSGKELEERLSAEAKAQAQELLSRTEQEIARRQGEMKEELKTELAALVIRASEKVLGEELPQSQKREQLERLVKTLN